MGLLDYYKQFEALSEEEVNSELRAKNAERKANALVEVESLDLSETISPHPTHPDVVSAVTFEARRGMHRYPRRAQLASELAHRLDVPVERIAVGSGASQLLQAAPCALMRPGQALLTPWPSHPLLPRIAMRAHGIGIPVEGGTDALLQAASEHDTRLIALARPNDPTGELIGSDELAWLLEQLPEEVAVLLDEALIEYADDGEAIASRQLLERYPRMLLFRSFSKAWGLAGLRCGYVIGGPGAEALIAELAPEHGISELTEAGVLEALRSCDRLVARQANAVGKQRTAITEELRAKGLRVTSSEANFLWVAHPEANGSELASMLANAGVIVASGAHLGDPSHVRISVRDEAARERLLSAFDAVCASAARKATGQS